MRNNKQTDRLPDKVEMEGPHLWWGKRDAGNRSRQHQSNG